MPDVSCPSCGQPAEDLVLVDAAVVAKLRENGNNDPVPERVCANCFKSLVGGIARGSLLVAHEKAREQRKVMLWKSRVGLIKKARQCMLEKAYSEAAVQYEKYMRVLEVVFDVKPGELDPKHFKDSARTQELTVVASAYWDLIRIYDTSNRYGDRMAQSAKKLAEFLPFTPIYPDILRKAEAFLKSAKNPEVLRGFLKSVGAAKSGCFLATAAFGSTEEQEVQILRTWRDQFLVPNPVGQIVVQLYYRISPPLASWVYRSPGMRRLVRSFLRVFVRLFL